MNAPTSVTRSWNFFLIPENLQFSIPLWTVEHSSEFIGATGQWHRKSVRSRPTRCNDISRTANEYSPCGSSHRSVLRRPPDQLHVSRPARPRTVPTTRDVDSIILGRVFLQAVGFQYLGGHIHQGTKCVKQNEGEIERCRINGAKASEVMDLREDMLS